MQGRWRELCASARGSSDQGQADTSAQQDLLSHIATKNVKTGEEKDLQVNGLFYAIGHEPATSLVREQVECDRDGYVITTPGTSMTSVKGVFAAGDVQDKKYKQAITSAGSGCIAALECERLLAEEEAEDSTGEPHVPEPAYLGGDKPRDQ